MAGDPRVARVGSVDPAAADVLCSSTAERLRRVAAAAVSWALGAGCPPRADVVNSGLAALAERRFGESEEREALEKLVDHLDEAAWDVQDEVDEGRAAYDDYGLAFRRARAVHCLWFALDDDALEAAAQALYEAYAAADSSDPSELSALIDGVG